MKKLVRITFRSEVYVEVQGETREEVLESANRAFESMPIFSADALEDYSAEVVEVVSMTNETDGVELLD